MSGLTASDNKDEAFQALVPGTPSHADGKGQTHLVNFTNTAKDSAIFHADTTLVQVFSTQDCWLVLKRSTDTTAAAIPSEKVKTYAKFLPGGISDFIGIPKIDGVQYMLSVIRNSADGVLYVTEGR